jgi:thymidylate kinase
LSVALIGPDGAGKSTLTEGLANSTGLPTRRIYMGLWQGEGETGDPVPLAAAILAAARRPVRSWRRAAVALYHQGRGRTVVFDRHPYDALLPPGPPHLRLKRIFFGFLARSVPPPSIVLVLDLPAEITHQRRPEEDPVQLATARDAYLALARRLRRAEVINADRTPDELRVEATARIWHAMVERRTR